MNIFGNIILFTVVNNVVHHSNDVDAFVVSQQQQQQRYGVNSLSSPPPSTKSQLKNAYLDSLSRPPSPTFGPPPQQQQHVQQSSSSYAAAAAASTSSVASPTTDVIATFDALQSKVMANIMDAIPDLESKPEFCWNNDEFISGHPTKLDAYDAPGPSNIAWISSLCINSKVSSLTIFNGPLTSVPHLISRCAIIDDQNLNFFLDFRPRSYGAYEMIQADGTYPGPEELGRQAFEYSGARRQFETNFGTDDVVEYLSSLPFENAVVNTTPLSEFDALTRGPLCIDMTMPVTDNNIAIINDVREKAAYLWLEWALDDTHAHRPGAPVNTQYVYDSKYKQNAYSALLPIYTNWFGTADGTKLAAADSGPLDEGYVGGGS